MTNLEAARQNARNGAELGDLRGRTNAAQRAAAVAAGTLPTQLADALERAGELFVAGYWSESRALMRREFEGSK